MSYARTRIKGLTFCDTRRASRGFTLVTPVEGQGVWMIDMFGEVVKEWQFQFPAGSYAELLPSGNILYSGRDMHHDLFEPEGATGIILEADSGGNVLWQYEDSRLHHGAFRMKNGNTLVMKWVDLPLDFSRKVLGIRGSNSEDAAMLGDLIQEIRSDGSVAWEWIAHENIRADELARCPLCPVDTWLHTNSVSELPNGNLLVSFCKVNTVGIIDKKTKNLVWRWGTDGELAHQHAPVMLQNGNILIFDNGYHPNGLAQNYSRLVEVARNKEKVWSYDGPSGGDMKQQIYSSMWSNCRRLANGNFLGCEGTTGRIFEVTKGGDLVWEWVNYLPGSQKVENPLESRSRPLFGALRYDMDYPGLRWMR